MWLEKYLEILVYVIPFSLIFFATLFIEYGIKSKSIAPFIGRKVLHIISLLCCAVSVYFSPDAQWHILIFFGAFLLLFLCIRFQLFFSDTGSYGIAFFALSFGLLLLFPFLNRDQILFAMLTLCFADAAAGIAGYFFAKQKILFLGEPKSWLGFMAFYGSTLLIYLFIFGWNMASLELGLLVALVAAISELFSIKGSDNLTTPLLTGIWVYLLQKNAAAMPEWWLITFILILLALAGRAKKILDTSGTMAALGIGLITCIAVQWNHIIPLVFFLITGSLVSRLNKDTLEKKGRNAVQVFANGLVAICCLLCFAITHKPVFEMAFFVAIAISLCDTVSSETGKYFKGKTIDCLSFKEMKPGLSGGISIAGTLYSFLAAIVYLSLLYFIYPLSLAQCITIGLTGFMGMLADSILGSSVQALYKNENGYTEEQEGILVKGHKWCTNDMVNLLSNIGTTAVFILGFSF